MYCAEDDTWPFEFNQHYASKSRIWNRKLEATAEIPSKFRGILLLVHQKKIIGG